MPVIETRVEDLTFVDARVTVTFSQLTDLMRTVLESNNQHDSDIEDLKKRLKAEHDRCNALEQVLSGLTGAESLTSEIAALKEEQAIARKERDEMGAQVAALETRVTNEREEDKKIFEGAQKSNCDRLESLEVWRSSVNVPDIEPVIEQIRVLNEFRDNATPKIDVADHFVQTWSADPEKLAQLCHKNRNGVYTSPTEDRTSYILTLPPFQESEKQYKGCDDFLRAELEEKIVNGSVVRGGGGDGGASRNELSQLASNVKQQQQAAKNALDFLDRRLKDNEDLPKRVAALEQEARALGLNKADIAAVDAKADANKVATLTRQTTEMRDDINDIMDRLQHRSAGDSVPVPASSGGSVSVNDLRRRVADLEAEAVRLEDVKADRTELQKLYRQLENNNSNNNNPTTTNYSTTGESVFATKQMLPRSTTPITNAVPSGECPYCSSPTHPNANCPYCKGLVGATNVTRGVPAVLARTPSPFGQRPSTGPQMSTRGSIMACPTYSAPARGGSMSCPTCSAPVVLFGSTPMMTSYPRETIIPASTLANVVPIRGLSCPNCNGPVDASGAAPTAPLMASYSRRASVNCPTCNSIIGTAPAAMPSIMGRRPSALACPYCNSPVGSIVAPNTQPSDNSKPQMTSTTTCPYCNSPSGGVGGRSPSCPYCNAPIIGGGDNNRAPDSPAENLTPTKPNSTERRSAPEPTKKSQPQPQPQPQLQPQPQQLGSKAPAFDVAGNSPRSRLSTPGRIFLGRSVAVVRDASGVTTPASIGMPQ